MKVTATVLTRNGAISLACLLYVAVAAYAVPVVKTFVPNPSSPPLPNEVPLGYPVPQPGTPEYRSFDQINAILGTASPYVTRRLIGTTRNSKPIYAARISSAGGTRDDGSPKPKILVPVVNPDGFIMTQ